MPAAAWDPQPLARGRHNVPREEVRASQRERLMRAMIERVAERGYTATTIREVAGTARVSASAFYTCFSDKPDCFLQAIATTATDLRAELLATAEEPTWLDSARRGTTLYLQWWETRPALGRAFFVGLPEAGGPRADAARAQIYADFTELFAALGRRARAEQPELGALHPVVTQALVFAITDLVAARCLAGASLLDLRDDILYLLVKLLADDVTAAAALAG